jgi:hypothetical protein
MAASISTTFTQDQLNIPTSDGDIIGVTGAYSEWDLFRGPETGRGGRLDHGSDVSIIKEMMDAVEEERNKELDRKIRIIGEALDALENMPSCQADWYSREDSWKRTFPGEEDEDEWPLHRVFAHFMLNPLDSEIADALEESEIDFEYEKWATSKQYVKSLEGYNRHKLLAYEKGESPQWAGECTGDFAMTTKSHGKPCVLYQTSLKDRYRIDAVIRTEFPNQRGNKGYAKASSAFGDIYIPEKFRGYIGQPGSPQFMTVALQDVGGAGKKGNGFRWTCIYTH